MQDGTTADMIWGVAELIEYISRVDHARARRHHRHRHAVRRRRLPRPAGVPRAGRPRPLRDRGHRLGREPGRRLVRRAGEPTSDLTSTAIAGHRCSPWSRPTPGPGLELRDVPDAGDRHQRRPDPGPQDRHLRHRPAHRVVGPVGRRGRSSRRSSSATSSSARSSRSAATSPTSSRATSCRGEGHVVCGRCRHCLAGRRHLCANTIGLGVGRDGAFAEYVALPMTNIWHHWPGIDEEVAAIFDPFGNAVHTALAFPVLGEDVLVSGRRPDRADGDGRRPPRRRAPRRRQRAERLPPRAGDPDGRDDRRRSRASGPSRTSFAELGMVEGFDVALEMSGNPAALRDRDREHGPRRRDRDPRHPDRGDRARRQRDRLQDADRCAGIYGREMYETWYKMTVMLQSGLDITPGDHPPLRVPRASRRRSPRPGRGDSGKVIMDWSMTHDRRRPDPLAFLDDEVAALARAPPLPAAAGHDRRPRARSSSVDGRAAHLACRRTTTSG